MLQEAMVVGLVKYRDPFLAKEQEEEKKRKKKPELTEEDLRLAGLLPEPAVPSGSQVAKPLLATEMAASLLVADVISVVTVAKARRPEKRKTTAAGPKRSKKAKVATFEGEKEGGPSGKKASLAKVAVVEAAAMESLVLEKVKADSVADEEARRRARAEEERRDKAELDAAIATSLGSTLAEVRVAEGVEAVELDDLSQQVNKGQAIVPVPRDPIGAGPDATPTPKKAAESAVAGEQSEGPATAVGAFEKTSRRKPRKLLPEGISQAETEAIFRAAGVDPLQPRSTEGRKKRRKQGAEPTVAAETAVLPSRAEGPSGTGRGSPELEPVAP